MSNTKTKYISALCAAFLILPSALFAAEGEWGYYSSDESLRTDKKASAAYQNGYDVFAISPNAKANVMSVYVEYWDKDLSVPTSMTATLRLEDGRAGIAEYELSDSFKDWQGTVFVNYALRYDDLTYFKQAVSYELNFGDKVMSIPMSGFDAAIDRAVANAD